MLKMEMNIPGRWIFSKINPVIFFSLFFAVPGASEAQFFSYPVEYFNSLITAKHLNAKDSSVHAGMQPYIPFFSDKYNNRADTHRVFRYVKEDPALDLVFFDHAIDLKPRGTELSLVIDPIINFALGSEFTQNTVARKLVNGRGIIASGYAGKNLYFETLFCENQATFQEYLNKSNNASGIIPGQGRWKRYKTDGYDYAYSSGFFSFQAGRHVNIQAGHGKHKVGNGYRSLLLSDNAFNYPYARITQQYFKGRLQYTNIYSVFTNLSAASANPNKFVEPLLQKKPAAFQYLSVNPAKFINVGLFQGVIWQSNNARNQPQLTADYFDPLIFVTAARKGLADSCNVLVGADLKIKLGNKISVYAQVAADDPRTDSTGIDKGLAYQAGVCFYDLFRVKNLFFQVEYNDVQEGTYNNPSIARTNQSYSHFNQNIAFAPGYGKELILVADYKYRRIFLNAKFHYQDVPNDGDYFYTTQVITSNLGFVINTSYNLTVSLGLHHRNQKFPNFISRDDYTDYVTLTLRTGLYNLYFDY